MNSVLSWVRENTNLDKPHCTVTITLRLDEFWTAIYLGERPEKTINSNIPGIFESTITTPSPGLTLTLSVDCDNAYPVGLVRETIRPKLTARARNDIIVHKGLKVIQS